MQYVKDLGWRLRAAFTTRQKLLRDQKLLEIEDRFFINRRGRIEQQERKKKEAQRQQAEILRQRAESEQRKADATCELGHKKLVKQLRLLKEDFSEIDAIKWQFSENPVWVVCLGSRERTTYTVQTIVIKPSPTVRYKMDGETQPIESPRKVRRLLADRLRRHLREIHREARD